ncbi:MAG: DUF2867 domain-containing protein [Thermodesulfobacteriota bacterium]
MVERLTHYQEIKPFITGADFVDIKTISGKTCLSAFIASMLSYYPWWISFLYRLREILVRMLGLVKHEKPYDIPNYKSDDIPFSPGGKVSFFTVTKAKENEYWFAETPEDKHLSAYFGVVVKQLENNLKLFYIITTIKYKHWTGPIYFNLIRPFHHLVVSRMAKAGIMV